MHLFRRPTSIISPGQTTNHFKTITGMPLDSNRADSNLGLWSPLAELTGMEIQKNIVLQIDGPRTLRVRRPSIKVQRTMGLIKISENRHLASGTALVRATIGDSRKIPKRKINIDFT